MDGCLAILWTYECLLKMKLRCSGLPLQRHSRARPVAVTTSRREAITQPGCRMAVRPNKLRKTLNKRRSFRSMVPTTCAILCDQFVGVKKNIFIRFNDNVFNY